MYIKFDYLCKHTNYSSMTSNCTLANDLLRIHNVMMFVNDLLMKITTEFVRASIHHHGIGVIHGSGLKAWHYSLHKWKLSTVQ